MGIDIGMLAGYEQGPFFYTFGDEGYHNYTVEGTARRLGLSAELAADLTAWDDEFQATLDLADPYNCGFSDPAAERAWIEKGKELAARIKSESPLVAAVDYQADGYYENGECVFR